MSLLLTPKDVYAFANAWQDQAIGKEASIVAANTSSLTSVGEAIMQSGMENTLNSFYLLLGKIWVSAKTYKGKGNFIKAKDTGVFTHRMAKISTYSRRAQASGYWNTDIKTNFAKGYTNGDNSGNSTPSMWEQNPPLSIVFNFGGSKVYDFQAPTVYLDKIEQAFRNESEFMSVVNSWAIEFANDMTQYEENFNREQLISAMAQDIDMESARPESVVHCVTEFNQENETSYTAKELTTLYAREFYSWLAAKIRIVEGRMSERSLLFHWSPTKTVNGEDYDILRFSDPSDLKAAILDPVFTKMETYVLPEIFHDTLLKIPTENMERFTYWQNINEPGKIDIIPAVNDTDSSSETYLTQIQGEEVEAQPILYLFNTDRLLTDKQLKRALTSPVEARKGYYNTFVHFAFNHISDATEQSCVFLMD